MGNNPSKSRGGESMNQIKKATHEGPLVLSGIEIPAYVLEDGTRLLSRGACKNLSVFQRVDLVGSACSEWEYFLPEFSGKEYKSKT